MKLTGVWLPIITPFYNGKVDFDSYSKLIDFYLSKNIHGIIPLGTTGEGPVIDESEYEAIIDKTVEQVNGRIPIFVGSGGNYTDKSIKQIKMIERYKVNGILSVCPYYNRPDQRGIYEHFRKLAESTDLKIIIYNIPYRTGRNIENETLFKLSEVKNIIGVKDSCGDFKQTMDLILNKPQDFSVLTGEDLLFFSTLCLGGDGGILATAHIQTEAFIELFDLISANNHKEAAKQWKPLMEIIPFLFVEPNPAPLKYYLHRKGLIRSPETRLPIMEITEDLEQKIDRIIKDPR
ncbi:MAG: 4-hydroxy-tetrahydrodipicolinate synthase [Desulfobacteraceae bacterium]|nr:MAG: 4-hydroxy-tetrahydrodipicolinate synthase [Desulfobacteraceae bacterium]